MLSLKPFASMQRQTDLRQTLMGKIWFGSWAILSLVHLLPNVGSVHGRVGAPMSTEARRSWFPVRNTKVSRRRRLLLWRLRMLKCLRNDAKILALAAVLVAQSHGVTAFACASESSQHKAEDHKKAWDDYLNRRKSKNAHPQPTKSPDDSSGPQTPPGADSNGDPSAPHAETPTSQR